MAVREDIVGCQFVFQHLRLDQLFKAVNSALAHIADQVVTRW